MQYRRLVALIACVVALIASGCGKAGHPPHEEASGSGAAAMAQGARRVEVKIAVVTHGQASDPAWSVVKNGVDRAAKDMGATVTYNAPQTFDMVAMSHLIDAEVANHPDGLVVSIPDAAALSRSIKAAVDAKIPVISMNSGAEEYRSLGVLLHVGQTEYEAGTSSGERMAAAGVKNALCVNDEVGNAALDLRCKGFLDALRKAGGTGKVLAVSLTDPTDTQAKISAALTPEIDGILTLGPLGAGPALAALRQTGRAGKVKLATFDLSPEVLDATRDGQIDFAIDQQLYLQGYLPVVLLTQHKRCGVMPAGAVIPTGPGFVVKETAADVIELSKLGLR